MATFVTETQQEKYTCEPEKLASTILPFKQDYLYEFYKDVYMPYLASIVHQKY